MAERRAANGEEKQALRVRDATAADLPRLVELYYSTFGDSLGASLGERHAAAVIRWFIDHPDGISIVCEDGERILGYGYGAPSGASQRLSRDLLPLRVWSVLTRPAVLRHPNFIRQLPLRVTRVLGFGRKPADEAPTVAAQTAYSSFDYVAAGICPTARGRGVGVVLYKAFQDRVWDAGYERIIGEAYASNTAVLRVYDRIGWVLFKRKGDVLLYGNFRPDIRERALEELKLVPPQSAS